jgi:prepilin-type N-terminal cleavage/methylation domain-containing protein
VIKNKIKEKTGFTLVELLVVMAIIAILTVITLGSFTESQKKSRDGARKANLKSLSEAINLYYADTGSFPSEASVTFGGELKRGTTIYMKKIPSEGTSGISNLDYQVSSTGKSFKLYTNLENDKDKDCACYLATSGKTPTCSSLSYTISSGCGYIITSSNISATGSLL